MSRFSRIDRPRKAPSKPRASLRRAISRRSGRTRYFAFLSYSHSDDVIADWLHEELEGFHVPINLRGRLTDQGAIPKTLRPIFRDRGELAAATDLGDEIRSALESSQFLIVLCSPAAARSRWTNAEIETFKRSKPDGCILAAIADGEPFASDIPGREAEECFPPALRHKYDRLGRPTGRRAEPLAADLREDGDGRRLGFLKLVAGMLGVGLDDLVQRENTRRQRRMAWIAVASLIGMVFAIGLAITAIRARDSARDQRREAEGLVAFMVGDLQDKLQPLGRLDVLDGVGSRVLDYYKNQDATELSDKGLEQRSKALTLMGQIAQARGNFDAAERFIAAAQAGTAESVRRSPDDPQRLFDHAQNIFWMGELERSRGQLKDAEMSYREYGRLATRMAALQPDNLKWRMEVAYARENLGIALFTQRRYQEAATLFDQALRPIQTLASLEPGNANYQNETGNALAWVAQAQWALGHLDASIADRNRQTAFLERQLRGNNTDVSVRQKLMVAHQALGVLLTAQGHVREGAAQFRLALDEGRQLIAIEPDNKNWKELSATVQFELARNLLVLGEQQTASALIATACQTTIALRAQDPSIEKWRSLQTTCLDRRARLAMASAHTAQALTFAERALAAARSERSGDPVTDRYRTAAQSRLLGDVRKRSGDGEGARAAWAAGFAQLPPNATERPLELNERTQLLLRLGRGEEAQPLAKRLAAMGYRNVN